MAQKQSSASKPKSTQTAARGKTAAKGSAKGSKPSSRSGKASKASEKEAPAPRASQPFVDERARRDIVGVVLIILGVALFVAAVLPTTAPVTSFLSLALHMGLGLGAYILPLLLAVAGIGLLVRVEQQRIPARVCIGLLVVFVCALALLALFSPQLPSDEAFGLFAPSELMFRGGYVGAGVAWLFQSLLGQVVSCILLLGLMVVGFVVIGFSLSGIVERLRAKHREAWPADDEVMPAPPLAFPRLSRSMRAAYPAAAPYDGYASAGEPTRAVGSAAPTAPLGDFAAAEADYYGPNGFDESLYGPTAEEDAANTVALDAPARPGRASRADASARTRRFTSDELPDFAQARPQGEQQAITRKLGRHGKEPDAAGEEARPQPQPKKRKAAAAEPKKTSDGYELPPASLLASSKGRGPQGASDEELSETAARLQETLEDFGILAEVVGWVSGPTVTLFKVSLPSGVRVSRVTNLTDDIALALAAPGVRIFAPIPGTNYVGIEVPNRERQTVYLADVLKSAGDSCMEVAVGKDVEGRDIVSDLSKMPHLLIAGTTGSGKSVEINGMIMSILMRATPAEVRFIMVDPKRVEFSGYNGIPHLYVPVVTECKEAASALSWGVAEMERRLKLFAKVGARNITSYNEKAAEVQRQREAAEAAGEEAPASDVGEKMPYIVIVIDELADLMMNVGKEVEFSISRIAQLARAAGIHLIIATQRPSTNVVTGLIKANITCRIGLTVASGIDSRVILDSTGAENLCGHGDLLISKPEYAKPVRVQGPWVSDDEIAAVVDFWKSQGEPEYHSEILQTNLITLGASQPDGSGGSCSADDPLLWEAAEIVVSMGSASTSNIQRRLSVGYSRAGRIMDMLEEKGVVGAPNGSKPREVLVDAMELETLKAFEATDE